MGNRNSAESVSYVKAWRQGSDKTFVYMTCRKKWKNGTEWREERGLIKLSVNKVERDEKCEFDSLLEVG